MKFYVACLFLVIAAFDIATATNFTLCKEEMMGSVTSVDLQDCPGDDECFLELNTQKTVKVVFVPSSDQSEVWITAVAKAGDFYKFPLLTDYVCETESLDCNLKAGETYTYESTLNIKVTDDSNKKYFESGKTQTLIFTLFNDDMGRVICFEIPTKSK